MKNLIKVNAYDEFREKINEVKDACDFIPDVTTKDGYEKSKRVALDVGKIKTALEKKRKELKADSIAYGKMIDSEAKIIVAELEQFQTPHLEAYKELDRLKKEREQQRKDKLEERVDFIRNLPELMRESDSSGVKDALDSLHNEECLDFFEYTEQALKARNSSRSALGDLYASKLKSEKEAVELAELRRKQAEQEQKEREEKIAREASEKAEAQAKAAKEAEQRAIEQANEAIKQREASEAKAKLDAQMAEERRIEAEANAKLAAEKAAEDARLAEVQRQQQQAKKEAEELEAREANKRHIGDIRKAAKSALMDICDIDEKKAKEIILAINAGHIPNVSIQY